MEGEIIGDKGLAYDAAAGVELDRYDLSLGTPPHTKIIASSGGHSDNYVLVTEELLYAYAGLTGSLDYRIRADMTFFSARTMERFFQAAPLPLVRHSRRTASTIPHHGCLQCGQRIP